MLVQRDNGLIIILLILLSNVAWAHNWMGTNGRARTGASTIRPCRTRLASDVHAQIGPDQRFTISTASGHSNTMHTIVVLAGEDEYMLAHSNFTNIIQDYVDNAPEGSNKAQDPIYRRYRTDGGRNPVSDYTEGPNYQGELDPDNFIYDEDIRVSYENEDHPWIQEVWQYWIRHTGAKSYDIFTVDVEQRKGPGHYVVAWRWNGYYDCIDVEVFDEPVTEIYGVENEGYVWNRIDHCQYVEYSAVHTACYEATASAVHCKNALPSQGNADGNTRYGINVVPIRNPASVYEGISHEVNIPWHLNKCGANTDSGFTDLAAHVVSSAHSVDWQAWESTALLEDSVECDDTLWSEDLTLRQAVLQCSPEVCVGLSWDKTTADAATIPYTGVFRFSGCASTATSGASESACVWKDNLPAAAVDDVEFEPVTINFYEHAGAVLQPDALEGYLNEPGYVFGERENGFVYGWNCEKTQAYSWNVDIYRNPEACCTPADDLATCEPCTADNTVVVAGWRDVDTCTPRDPSDLPNMEELDFNYWQIELPNGKYSVTLHNKHGPCDDCKARVDQCMVGNTQLEEENNYEWDDGENLVREYSLTNDVEVYNGVMRFEGNSEKFEYSTDLYCGLSSLDITRTGAEIGPSSWLPAQSDPWIMMELSERRAIGRVHLINQDWDHCASYWLYFGKACRPDGFGRVMGTAHGAGVSSGYIIRVSDEPCSGTTCPGTICATNSHIGESTETISEYCEGLVGKYVSLQLPGAERVLGLVSMELWTTEPPDMLDLEEGFICYGVEAVASDALKPEYEVSNDPEDPGFYSTCFSRESNVTWLPMDSNPQPPPWLFADFCLECELYHANQLYSDEAFPVVRWAATRDTCQDCAEYNSEDIQQSALLAHSGSLCASEGGTCDAAADPSQPEQCSKQLQMAGRDSGITARVTLEECEFMTLVDLDCSNVFVYNSDSECYCHRSDPCCGECVLTTDSNSDVYHINL